MQGFNKRKYFQFIILMLMASTFLPIVFNNLPPIIRSHHVWTVILGISLLIFIPKVFAQKLMLLIAIYGIYLMLMLNVFSATMNEGNVRQLWLEFYAVAVGASIISYFNVSKDYYGFAKITKYTLFFLCVTAVFTITASFIDPMYARNVFQDSMQGDASRLLMSSLGAGNYGTALAFMALIPLLIYLLRNNQALAQKKWIIFLLIFLFFITIFRMQIFTNILVAICFAILAWVPSKKRKRSFIILGIVTIIILSIPTQVYGDLSNKLSVIFSNMEDVSFKFKELADYINTGGEIEANEFAYRAERLPKLLEVFPKSPVFGCFFLTDKSGHGYEENCFHLYWMNKIVVTGLVGFLFFISILITFMKGEYRKIEAKFRYFFILSLLSVVVYGIFKNVVGRECWYLFFVVAPGIYYLPLLKQKAINKNEGLNSDIK